MITRNELYYNLISRLFPDDNKIPCRSITIQVTDNCNLCCTYCYQHSKTTHKLTIEDGKKFIDLLLLDPNDPKNLYFNSSTSTGIILEFIGGEPLLEIDTINILTDYFISEMIRKNHPWATKFRISMCSNGLLYFKPEVQQYIQKHINHLGFTISIDGNKQLHDSCRIDKDGNGSYDRAIKAAEHFQQTYHRHLGTKITLSPFNIKYTSNAVISFIERGETIINVNYAYEKGWSKSDAKILYDELKRVSNYILEHGIQDEVLLSILHDSAGSSHIKITEDTWCGGNGDMLALDTYGDIYPCLRYMPSSIGPTKEKLILGNIHDGLVVTDKQKQLLANLKAITRVKQDASTPFCSSCPISEGCGDCAAYSYEIFGEIGHRTTFICDMHKARCLAQVYYKNKYYMNTSKGLPMPLNVPRDWAISIIGEEEYNMLEHLAQEAGKLYLFQHPEIMKQNELL